MLYWLTKYLLSLGRGFADNSEFRPARVLERLCESVYTLVSQITNLCSKLESVSNMT